jgi:hypothetical protein
MGYSDQKYYSKDFYTAGKAVTFGTATAANSTGCDLTIATFLPPVRNKRMKVVGIKMIPTTAPDSGSTAIKAHFLNGTTTFGVVTLTTSTVGQTLEGVVTDAYSTFTASQAIPTLKMTGTATASADVNGVYDIYFETQELP